MVRLKLHAACGRVTAGENDGAIIALLTIVLALYSVRLAESTGRLVQGAEDTAERQLRAYMYISAIQLLREPNGRMVVKVEVKNYGQTPAYHYRSRPDIFVAPFPFISGGRIVRIETTPPSKQSVAPSATKIVSDDITNILQGKAVAIIDGREALWVCGSIHYDDAFRKPRTTSFRLFCRTATWETGLFLADENGNESD